MRVRINFWYKGLFSGQSSSKESFLTDISETDSDITKEAENALESAIITGLIDHLCDSGIRNFGITSVDTNPGRKRKYDHLL